MHLIRRRAVRANTTLTFCRWLAFNGTIETARSLSRRAPKIAQITELDFRRFRQHRSSASGSKVWDMNRIQVNAELFFVHFGPLLGAFDNPRHSDYLGFELQLPETLCQLPGNRAHNWGDLPVPLYVLVWPFLNTICVQVWPILPSVCEPKDVVLAHAIRDVGS
jgi:hypothetical protein